MALQMKNFKKNQKNFKDMIATKKLASENRDILRSIKIPGTDIKTGSLWDLVTTASISVKSHIESKLAES